MTTQFNEAPKFRLPALKGSGLGAGKIPAGTRSQLVDSVQAVSCRRHEIKVYLLGRVTHLTVPNV